MDDALTNHKKNAPRQMRRSSDTTFDRIYKYYFIKKSNIELTAEENVIRERWDFAWQLLSNMHTRRQVVEAALTKFNIEKSVAYDDVNKAMMLFGDPQRSTKEAKMAMVDEWITLGLKKAWDNHDLQAYEKLLGRYMKLNKLEGDTTTDMADLVKKFKAHTIMIFSSPEELQREAQRLQEGVIHDVNYIDLSSDEGEEDRD